MDNEQYVTSNGIKIPFTPAYFEKMTPSFLVEGEELRTKLLRDGYVLIKSVLDRESVLKIREQYFSLFDPMIFKEGTKPAEGIFSGKFQFLPSQHGHKNHPASQFVQTEAFDHFTKNKKLFELAALLLGEKAALLRRRPIRQFYSHTQIATRAHADFSYLDQGTPHLISVWIPLGDVGLHEGGIIYLKDSMQLDRVLLRQDLSKNVGPLADSRPIASDLKAVSETTHRPWMYSEFEAGDIVVHSPFIVHATLDCASDTMRLSTDIRFVNATENPDPRWMDNWRGDDGY